MLLDVSKVFLFELYIFLIIVTCFSLIIASSLCCGTKTQKPLDTAGFTDDAKSKSKIVVHQTSPNSAKITGTVTFYVLTSFILYSQGRIRKIFSDIEEKQHEKHVVSPPQEDQNNQEHMPHLKQSDSAVKHPKLEISKKSVIALHSKENETIVDVKRVELNKNAPINQQRTEGKNDTVQDVKRKASPPADAAKSAKTDVDNFSKCSVNPSKLSLPTISNVPDKRSKHHDSTAIIYAPVWPAAKQPHATKYTLNPAGPSKMPKAAAGQLHVTKIPLTTSAAATHTHAGTTIRSPAKRSPAVIVQLPVDSGEHLSATSLVKQDLDSVVKYTKTRAAQGIKP